MQETHKLKSLYYNILLKHSIALIELNRYEFRLPYFLTYSYFYNFFTIHRNFRVISPCASSLSGIFFSLPSSSLALSLRKTLCPSIFKSNNLCVNNPFFTRSSFSSSAFLPSFSSFALFADDNKKQSLKNENERLIFLQKNVRRTWNNPTHFADILKEANAIDPLATISFYEECMNEEIKRNDAVLREYIKALVYSQEIQNVSPYKILTHESHERNYSNISYNSRANISQGKNMNSSFLPLNSQISSLQNYVDNSNSFQKSKSNVKFCLDSSSQPLKITVVESHKKNFWRVIRSLIGMLIVVSAISVFAEGLTQNVQKGFGVGAKKIAPVTDTKITFEDVKGCDEVKEELHEIIEYLRDRKKFTRLGAKLPKGVLLNGPPGTGKTLLARAIAGEAKVPFIQTSASEFEEMFVGVGARRIRDLFNVARSLAPCIVFIDEIDAVGSKRSNRDHTAVRMTLNQLLVQLDGFEQNEGVVVICATNFLESLDPALTRAGRLDKTITVPLPDLSGRSEILAMYGKRIALSNDVDLSVLARRTAGMTGADLFNILNIAAVRSSADGLSSVSMQYIEDAFDRVIVGLERRNPMTEADKTLTAYHEAGHTIVSLYTKHTDPVHKATIMPRGSALGITWMIPKDEKYNQKLIELEGKLTVLMGGKAAEELIYGFENVTTGCRSDLKSATQLATSMVMHYGMCKDEHSFPMYIDAESYGVLSDEFRAKIDRFIQSLLNDAYKRAKSLLENHLEELRHLANALVEYETLSKDEINLAVSGKCEEIGRLRKEKKLKAKLGDQGNYKEEKLENSKNKTSSLLDKEEKKDYNIKEKN